MFDILDRKVKYKNYVRLDRNLWKTMTTDKLKEALFKGLDILPADEEKARITSLFTSMVEQGSQIMRHSNLDEFDTEILSTPESKPTEAESKPTEAESKPTRG